MGVAVTLDERTKNSHSPSLHPTSLKPHHTSFYPLSYSFIPYYPLLTLLYPYLIILYIFCTKIPFTFSSDCAIIYP